jgi:hypothetical protein
MGINGFNRKINAKLSTVVLLAMASMLPACGQLEQGQRILSGMDKPLKNPGLTQEHVKAEDRGRLLRLTALVRPPKSSWRPFRSPNTARSPAR